MIRLLLISTLTMMCIGCQSSDVSLQHYQLAKSPKQVGVNASAPQVIIEPVVLVDYLKQPNILLKQQQNSLYVTKYHVWAEPLDKAIARTMVNYLNQQGDEVRVEHGLFAQCAEQSQCVSLRLYVEAFYPTDDSLALFSGKYQLIRAGKLIGQYDFNLTNELTLDGYPHAVEQLQQLVYQLSSQIKQQLPPKA